MARTDTFTANGLVSGQLPRFLAAFGAEPPEGLPTSLGVAESFQVWRVSLEDFRLSGAEQARWSDVWHHQLRSANGKAESFARSLERGVPELRAVYRSALAKEIHDAIGELDEDPVLRDDAFLVRLLEISEIHLTAIWIIGGGTNQFIPLGKFASREGPVFVPISKEDLVSRLPEKPVIGIADTPPPDRRSDFLSDP